MLRIIKGIVVAFVISFLVFVPTISAQAVGGSSTPSQSVTNATMDLSAAVGFTVTHDARRPFPSQLKGDAKEVAEANREAGIVTVQIVSASVALVIILGILFYSTYCARKRKKLA